MPLCSLWRFKHPVRSEGFPSPVILPCNRLRAKALKTSKNWNPDKFSANDFLKISKWGRSRCTPHAPGRLHRKICTSVNNKPRMCTVWQSSFFHKHLSWKNLCLICLLSTTVGRQASNQIITDSANRMSVIFFSLILQTETLQ